MSGGLSRLLERAPRTALLADKREEGGQKKRVENIMSENGGIHTSDLRISHWYVYQKVKKRTTEP